MTDGTARLSVEGAVRATGPEGSFRVEGDGHRLVLRAPGLLAAWRLARWLRASPALAAVEGWAGSSGLRLEVVVRGQVVAASASADDGVRVDWAGVGRAALALLSGRSG